jgi:hypothetical protein
MRSQGRQPDGRVKTNNTTELVEIDPEKTLQHYRTIQALPLILGPEKGVHADYLDVCRAKRNTVEYDRAGAATIADAKERIEFTKELREQVMVWLEQNHIELLLPGDQRGEDKRWLRCRMPLAGSRLPGVRPMPRRVLKLCPAREFSVVFISSAPAPLVLASQE